MSAVRDRLLRAGLEQLERADSIAEVTVTSLTRAAGCTAPSMYHYWPTREALLDEAAAQGWAEFAADQHQGGAGPERAGDRVLARGRAYVRFAQHRPHLFRLLFLTRSSASNGPGSTFLSLVEDVAQAQAAGEIVAGDPTRVALAAWAAAHGVACLLYANPSLGLEPALEVLDTLSAPLMGRPREPRA